MKSMEGVRKVTNRMELVQSLRKSLVKARLSLVAVVAVLVLSAAVNVVMFNKLQKANEVIASQQTQIVELEDAIEVVTTEKEELAVKLDVANSFETLMDKVANLEDLALEAVHNAVDTVEGFVANNLIETNVPYVDYVLNSRTGETIRTFETEEEMFVVYLSDNNKVKQLDEEISTQYYLGTDNYEEAINKIEDAVIIKHELK